MIIAPEQPEHFPAVRALLLESFPSPLEADLVERLRRDGDMRIARVALDGGRVVGHAAFSQMRAPFRALGLGPVATAADKRRQGAAAALIEAGLRAAKADGWEAVFVLGDPAYYRRFGFRPELAEGFASPYAGPYLLALALAGEFPATTGRVDYAPAFDGPA